jgi:hypothetical protein
VSEWRDLERGQIRFYARPRVGFTAPQSLADVQRFFFLLVPRGGASARRIKVGRKRMPNRRERCWAHVERVSALETLEASLGSRSYETKTRGTRHQGAAIELARGSYLIASHHSHAHLVWELEDPDALSPLAVASNLVAAGGCIGAVFNSGLAPQPPAVEPPEDGVPFREPSIFEDEEADRFGDRKSAPLAPELLDVEGAELVLIGASDETAARANVEGCGSASSTGRSSSASSS